MGCDGGTIPKRDELVRTKKRPEQKDRHSELSFRWGHCAITQQPLQQPIVACQLGRLYNKDAVIETILDKSQTETTQHIKNLKDVKDLNLTGNPGYQQKDTKGDSLSANTSAQFICPVIGLEMNGKFRFIYLWSCGCVMSERALKAVKAAGCHKCLKPFTEEDIIILSGTEEDVESLKVRLASRQSKLKAEKKAKKNGIKDADKRVDNEPSTSGSLPNQKTVDTKINIEAAGSSKSTLIKRPLSTKSVDGDPSMKKIKADYSVAKDPNASDVYKSLFTSHKNAAQKSKAHWITYNPFYN